MKSFIFLSIYLFSLILHAQSFFGSLKLGVGDVSLKTNQFDDVGIIYSGKYDTEFTYGLNAGYLIAENISLGINLNYYKTKTDGEPSISLDSIELSWLPILAEATWYASPAISESTFYIGGLMGITLEKSIVRALNSTPPTESNASYFTYGIKTGYQFLIQPSFTLSPEFSYIIISRTGDDAKVWFAQLSASYWF